MSKLNWLIVGAVALVLVGAIYLSNQFQNNQASNQSQQNQGLSSTPNITATPNTPASISSQLAVVKTFEIEGKSFEFSPKEIRVNQGDTVRIVFKNTQGFHDWTISEFSAHTKQIKAGETDTVEFVVNKKGTFEYYCSVGNHRQMGMVGKLMVE